MTLFRRQKLLFLSINTPYITYKQRVVFTSVLYLLSVQITQWDTDTSKLRISYMIRILEI